MEGIDAAHKLTIMSAIAFGIPLQFEKTYTEGISGISPADISFAEELDIGSSTSVLLENGPWSGVAGASYVGFQHSLLANVNGVGNAVMVQGNFVGSTLYSGPGAGAEATASAVVADLIDLARDRLAGVKAPVRPALGLLKQALAGRTADRAD